MTVAQNQFEIERRAIMWTPLTTLNDGVTSLTYDADPNLVSPSGSAGEQWLYSLPVGQFYKQSNAILWWKTGTPNVWTEVGEGGGGGKPPITVNTNFYVDGDTGDNTNDGLSWATAKKNLDLLDASKANSISRQIYANVTVNVRGTVLSTDATKHVEVTGFTGLGYIRIVGVETETQTGIAVTGFENVSTNMKYHAKIEASGESWTVDELVGKYVKITSGTGMVGGVIYPIASNTATEIQTTNLDDLATDSVFSIIELPKIKGATIADPSTLVDYGRDDFVFVSNNVVGIAFDKLDFTDVLNYSQNLTIKYTRHYTTFVFCNISSNIVSDLGTLTISACNVDVTNWQWIDIRKSFFSLYNSVVRSSDGTSYGVYPQDNSTVRVGNNNRFIDQYEAISGDGTNEINVVSAYFENCQYAITLKGGNITIGLFGSEGISFDSCGVCFDVGDTKVTVGSFVAFVEIGNTTDVKNGDTETFTLADIIARRPIRNATMGGAFAYYDSSAYTIYSVDEYDNVNSGLSAVNFQDAIDELSTNISTNKQIDTFLVDATIISNNYIDLTISPNISMHIFVNWNGLELFEGASEEFTVSGQRITFSNITLTPNDKIQVKYEGL